MAARACGRLPVYLAGLQNRSSVRQVMGECEPSQALAPSDCARISSCQQGLHALVARAWLSRMPTSLRDHAQNHDADSDVVAFVLRNRISKHQTRHMPIERMNPLA
jgi:hypothetical protein